ncbi:MAG: SH3 domain-containing protein [Saprospiraceae bacterium]|nr:SH3 domain-containing protein [Saprospiraceae bacterium]
MKLIIKLFTIGFILFLNQSVTAQTYIVNASRAYFHNQPNTETKRTAYVILGDKVEVLESRTGWAKVIYKASNTIGWMRSEVLSIEKLSKVQCERAYFHNLPNTESRLNSYVITSDNVQVLAELDGWKKVIFYGAKKNTVGWLQNTCLQTSNISDLIEMINNYEDVAVNRPKVYAVIVGVSTYSTAQNNRGVSNLQYSDDDAYKMYEFLKSPNGGQLPSSQIKLLVNEEASLANVLFHSKNLYKKAQPQDLILFYFSGHGGPNTFVGYDKNITHTEIKEILNSSPAKKKLCVADACHSGSLGNSNGSNRASSSAEMIDNYYEALAATSDGIALFLSSKADEYSIEVSDFGQGVFTYYYIEGLKGYADNDHNGIITIEELYDYTRKQVEDYTRNGGRLQRPQLKGTFDHQMPVGVTN